MTDALSGGPTPLVVIDGDATAEEVAALLAVLAAAGGGDGMPQRPARHTGWASRESAAGALRRPGPTTWRASGLPG